MSKKHIHAVLVQDWVRGREDQTVPLIISSNHPRFKSGERFDWGYVQIALDEGYSLKLDPLNTHPPVLHKGCE